MRHQSYRSHQAARRNNGGVPIPVIVVALRRQGIIHYLLLQIVTKKPKCTEENMKVSANKNERPEYNQPVENQVFNWWAETSEAPVDIQWLDPARREGRKGLINIKCQIVFLYWREKCFATLVWSLTWSSPRVYDLLFAGCPQNDREWKGRVNLRVGNAITPARYDNGDGFTAYQMVALLLGDRRIIRNNSYYIVVTLVNGRTELFSWLMAVLMLVS